MIYIIARWIYYISLMVGFVVSIANMEDTWSKTGVLFLLLMAQHRFQRDEQDLIDHKYNHAAHSFQEYWRR